MNDKQLSDLSPDNSATELHVKKQQEIKYNYKGSTRLEPGQKLWCWNMETQKLSQVDLQKESNYDMVTDKNLTTVKRLNMNKDCLYVPAINEKNAMRKVLKHFGFHYSKSGVIRTSMKVEKVQVNLLDIPKADGTREMVEIQSPEHEAEIIAQLKEQEQKSQEASDEENNLTVVKNDE